MEKYDFDEIIERRNTESVKFDLLKPLFGQEDLIPMWVADMDFRTPPFVRDAVIKRAEHDIYGYSVRSEGYFESIINWYREQQSWDIRKEWIVFSPGIVPALNLIVMSCTSPGDKVIVQPPVYFPFFSAIKNHGRRILYNQLIREGDRYSMDFDDLEKKAAEGAKMIFLCSPHNPVSRVWTKQELIRFAAICRKYGLLIVSDEIHSDLVYPEFVHTPLAGLSEETASLTLTCIAPSKTFNLAGLSTSSVVIPDKTLRNRFETVLDQVHVGSGNIFGNIAAEAAYRNGKNWLSQLMFYLSENVSVMKDFLEKNLPFLKLVPPEATYLLWVDFSGAGLSGKELKRFIIDDARLALNDGPMFGPGGEGFQRFNIACPRQKMVEALFRLKEAFDKRKR